MKKSMLTIFVFCIFFGFSHGQSKIGITTEEEYNYMTKGYQLQLSGGLDKKLGYSFGTETVISEKNYNFKFIPFYRVSVKDSTLVGFIVKAVSTTWNNTYWYGFPFGDKNLLNKTFAAISILDENMTTAFFKAYAEFNMIKY